MRIRSKKLFLLIAFAFFVFHFSSAQGDSCTTRISLLTCAPGEELYSTFGHTALRVSDPAARADYVYNYGTFEFGPDFYTQFIRGKLLYFLSVEDFNDFMYQYQAQSRSVQEQVLALSCAEKQQLIAALQLNAQEKNRYYRYDFLFDNCTTRARDIVKKNTAAPVAFKTILPPLHPSFRHLIHSYLDAGHQDWSKLGIDLLLGAKLDRRVSDEEAMFLPDYLLKGFDSAAVNGHALVGSKQTILQMPSPLKGRSFFTPAVAFSILLALVVLLSLVKARWAAQTVLVIDFLFFFVLGLSGILLLFMWFGTDHIVCRNNYNLAWALPTHAIAAFFVHSKRAWVKKYFGFVCGFSVLLAVAWFFLPQQMNPALIPVLFLVIYRGWHLSKKQTHAGTATNR